MNSDDKILKAIEGLQSDITEMKGEVNKIPTIQKQLDHQGETLAQHGKILTQQGKTLAQHGKILETIGSHVATILEEQQAQRIDIRSLHTELHASKEELKSEILSARAEARADSMDLKASATKQLKDHEQRIDALEDDAGIPHPDKN
jgi:chromosome segregation ATPase